MGASFDIVVRDAYVQPRDETLDIGIRDGMIRRVADAIAHDGDVEVDADDNLVSPGFVDSHVHMDMARSRMGDRQPTHNEDCFSSERSRRLTREHFEQATRDSIEQTVYEVARTAVANGVLHARTHSYLDEAVGTKSIEATLAARDRLDGLLDLEVVAFPQQGVSQGNTEAVLRAALRAGADLVGGLDPASHNRDVRGTLETWFDVATDFDVGIDVHLHDPGSLGLYTLDQLLSTTRNYGYRDRVTASHSYALADGASRGGELWIPGGSMDAVFERCERVGLQFVTCYLSTRASMPVERLQEHGIALGHGSDQVRDLWLAHGNVDPIEAALIQSLRLGSNYEYTTNRNLDRIWELITAGGAAVLGIEDTYGCVPDTPANLLVHDSPSRQWAIVDQSTPRVVIKDGQVVARNGALVT